jgi:single-stranded DNA-binding protein
MEGGGLDVVDMANGSRRTLVYVEGDASMSQYTDAEGKPRSALNLIQRKLSLPLSASLLTHQKKNSRSCPRRNRSSK